MPENTTILFPQSVLMGRNSNKHRAIEEKRNIPMAPDCREREERRYHFIWVYLWSRIIYILWSLASLSENNNNKAPDSKEWRGSVLTSTPEKPVSLFVSQFRLTRKESLSVHLKPKSWFPRSSRWNRFKQGHCFLFQVTSMSTFILLWGRRDSIQHLVFITSSLDSVI